MAQELKRSLEFNDLIGFGVASIMGSGGFNLIGDGIITGGPYFPIALSGVAVLFQGLSRVYDEAHSRFKSNTSESDLIKQQFGDIPAKLSSISILLFNILSVCTIVVICSKLLFPTGSWSGQVSFAFTLLSIMTMFSLKGIDVNKDVINFFSLGIIVLLTLASTIGIIEFGQKKPAFKFPEEINGIEPDFGKSILYFFFILAGFDTLMKFSEESKNPDKDVSRSFYVSNALSTILTVGVCFTFLIVFSKEKFGENENIIARIVESMLGKDAGQVTASISIVLMVITSFILFLANTRYMYSLGKEYPTLSSFTELNENKAPWVPIIVTFIISTLGILCNHVFTLVKVSDFTLTVTLLLVSAAATRAQLANGKVPIVEGVTTVSIFMILCLCFNSFF